MSIHSGIFEYGEFKIRFRTSYFAKFSKLGRDCIPVSICMWDPKWFGGIRFESFIPLSYDSETDCESCAKLNGSQFTSLNCRYLNCYRKQLEALDLEEELLNVVRVADFVYGFNKLSKQLGTTCFTIVFLGYEVPEKICSERFVLTEVVNKSFDNLIEELVYDEKS